jgi:ATP-binding cassette, subfamily B, bacterial
MSEARAAPGSGDIRAPARTARVFLVYGFLASPFWMVAALTLIVGAALASVFYPVGIKVFIDAFLAHDKGGIVLGAALVSGLYALQWILSNNGATAGTNLSDHVNLFLSARIATLVNAVAGLEQFERPEYLQELDLLDENRPLLANGPRQAIIVLSVVVRTVGVVILLGLIWWPLAFLPIVSVLPTLAERSSVRIRQRSEERLAEDRRLANELFEISAGAEPAKELRVYGLAPELAERHHAAGQRVATGTVRAALAGGAIGVTGWLLFAVGFTGAIVAVAVRATHGEASAGEVVLAVTLVQRAQFQVAQAANSVGQLLTMARTARRLFWIEDYASRARTHAAGLDPPSPLVDGIRLDRVSFTYPGSEERVLHDVTVRLPAGKAIAIVGSNGAGKTTLVKLLTRMYEPTAGQVLVDGTPIDHLDLDRWRSRTSAAFQDFARPELLAGETVGIGDLPRIADEAAVDLAVDRAGASSVIAALPGGLSAPLGRSFRDGLELSGGQWQKLALSRSMMRDTPLLLVLDEPTASLDALTEHAVFERYVDAARRAGQEAGAITILVSHRFSTVALADLILVLDRGRVTEAGSHAELLAQGGMYAELYRLQAAAYR